MRTIVSFVLLLFLMEVAHAHSYRFGNIEIVHPTIMVPPPNSDCTCAHVTIVNHGSEIEYFLSATIAIASDTRLLQVAGQDEDITAPSSVPIPPGTKLELRRHDWCLFLSKISKNLEADVGVYPAHLIFRHAGALDIEFMVDAPHH